MFVGSHHLAVARNWRAIPLWNHDDVLVNQYTAKLL